MPGIDYLVITHDHWDHLDYNTVVQLKERVGKVVCPLGVGEHFEYWGFDKARLVELDWFEDAVLDEGFLMHCLPSRRYCSMSRSLLWRCSRRRFFRNRWRRWPGRFLLAVFCNWVCRFRRL